MTEPWPRVTRILQATRLGPDFSTVAPNILGAALRRGTLVHEAIARGLRAEEYPERLRGYGNAYEKFLAESKFEQVYAEQEVRHPVWKYQGHFDAIGWYRGRRTLVDYKTSEVLDIEAVGHQLAAYRAAWNAENPSELVFDVAAVGLHADGSYQCRVLDWREYENAFFAAVVVYYAQQRRRRR